jgi:Ribophorin I
VNVPYETVQTWTRRFTFLDTNFNGGRPVLTIRSKNVVEEHEKHVVISYSFNKPRMLVEPGLLVMTYFCFFLLCSLIVRLGGEKKQKKA